jgi:hypothetical protein
MGFRQCFDGVWIVGVPLEPLLTAFHEGRVVLLLQQVGVRFTPRIELLGIVHKAVVCVPHVCPPIEALPIVSFRAALSTPIK